MKIYLIFLIVFLALSNASRSKSKYRNYDSSGLWLPTNNWQAFARLGGIGQRSSNIDAYRLRNAAVLSAVPNKGGLAEQIANEVVQETVIQTAQQAAQEAYQRNQINTAQVGQDVVEKAVYKVAEIAAVKANQENLPVDTQAAEIAATIARPIIQQAVTEASQAALSQRIGSLDSPNEWGAFDIDPVNRWNLLSKINSEFNWNTYDIDDSFQGGIGLYANRPENVRIVALRAAQQAARQSARVAFQEALQSPDAGLLGVSGAFDDSINLQPAVLRIVEEAVRDAIQQSAYSQGLATSSNFAQQNGLLVAQEAALKACKLAVQIGLEKAAELELQRSQYGSAINPLSVVAQQKVAENVAAKLATDVVNYQISDVSGGSGIGFWAFEQNRNVGATELVAEQAADKIVQESEFKQENQVQKAIRQIDNQRQSLVDSPFLQTASASFLPLIQGQNLQAIQDLQRQNQQQQIASIKSKQDLENTLQALIQAQITSENVPNKNTITGGNAIYDDRKVAKFNAQLEELVTKNNIEQTKKIIAQAESEAQQLQEQRQLIAQQKQKIENQQNDIGQWRIAPRQAVLLDRAQEKLYAREQQLQKELLAKELVIQQLQQVLIEQKNELKSSIVADKMAEDVSQLKKYSSFRSL